MGQAEIHTKCILKQLNTFLEVGSYALQPRNRKLKGVNIPLSAPVIEEPVVNTGGVEQVEAGQSPDHVTREEVPETDHAVLTPILHQAGALTRSEYSKEHIS